MKTIKAVWQSICCAFQKIPRKTWETVGILSLALLLLIDLGYHLISSMKEDPETMTARRSVMSETVSPDAVILRNEVPLSVKGERFLFLAEDGERVNIGTPLIEIYPVSTSPDDLAALQAELSLRSLFSDADKARLDKIRESIVIKIEGKLLAIDRALENGNIQKAAREESTLQALMLLKERLLGTLSLEDAVKDSDKAIAALREKLGSPKEIVTAEQVGWFSSDCDGYESLLSSEDILKKSHAELSSLFDVTRGTVPIAKLILSHKTYAVSLLDSETARRFRQNASYQVEFDAMAVTVKLEKTLLSGDGGKTVLLFSTPETAKTVSLRRISRLSVTLTTYEGYKIPTSAIAEEEGVFGVYILKGFRVEFREIAVLYRDGNTALCDPTHEGSRFRALSENDHVIIKGDDLYDGKIL